MYTGLDIVIWVGFTKVWNNFFMVDICALDWINLESRDPKEFWKLIKDLRERKRNNLSDNIDPQTWYEWFKKLNQSEIPDNDKTLSTIIKNMEDFAPKFSKTLDEYISIQEIKSAATKLKKKTSLHAMI